MSAKNKLQRFADNEVFPNVIQPQFEEIFHKDYKLKNQWKSEYWHNSNPIVLELGCGKGEYTVALAQANPEKNHIGIDIKGARFWRGAGWAKIKAVTLMNFNIKQTFVSHTKERMIFRLNKLCVVPIPIVT